MRYLALSAALACLVAPAMAQRAVPGPPAPLREADYVEADCSGGIAGIDEQVRVFVDGRIVKAARRGGVLRARATPAEVARIWRKLDIARFERRTVRGGRYPPDGITCTLSRQQRGSRYTVVIPQVTRNDDAVADLRSVLADVEALGRRATGPILRPAAVR